MPEYVGDTCSFVLTQFRRKDFSGRGTGQMERGVPAGMNPTFLKGITQYRKIILVVIPYNGIGLC